VTILSCAKVSLLENIFTDDDLLSISKDVNRSEYKKFFQNLNDTAEICQVLELDESQSSQSSTILHSSEYYRSSETIVSSESSIVSDYDDENRIILPSGVEVLSSKSVNSIKSSSSKTVQSSSSFLFINPKCAGDYLDDCIFDSEGSILNTDGDCYSCCPKGNYLTVFYLEFDKILCCCSF
jgi:hypothetical protein